MAKLTFLEFFAGGGMVRAGLGDGWRCLFANDFDAMKAAAYVANWGGEHFSQEDVANLALSDLPDVVVDLAWASFPCQDLSLAGSGQGLGLDRDNRRTRSGTFWPFWRLMRALVEAGRAPRTIVLENVLGCLTSHGGKDFAAIASALSDAGYRFGAVVINAAHFVPQSRARVFFVAIWQRESIPDSLVAPSPRDAWRPASLLQAHAGMPETAKQNWVWWNLAKPPARAQAFADLIEDPPSGVEWHSPAHTNYLLQLMSPLNRQKVDDAIRSKSRAVGTIYRRTRPDDNCVGCQRAEVRFDDVAGCLRTPRGGSSRQTLLIVEDESVRSRLLSPREAARLMGLDDCYRLPARYNDAYHVCGDGVCVPVVRFIASRLLEPLLASNCSTELMAAE